MQAVKKWTPIWTTPFGMVRRLKAASDEMEQLVGKEKWDAYNTEQKRLGATYVLWLAIIVGGTIGIAEAVFRLIGI